MHPDMAYDMARFHIEDLHRQAARHRLARLQSRVPAGPRPSGIWTGLGFRRLRSKSA